MTNNDLSFKFVARSSNSKIGPMPTTYTSRNSCPSSCVFNDGTCYGLGGGHAYMQWMKVVPGAKTILNESEFFTAIESLPDKAIWRHNTLGDLPQNKRGKLAKRFLNRLVKTLKRTRAIVYTHVEDYPGIRQANEQGASIIKSLNHISDLNDPNTLTVPTSTVVNYDLVPRKDESTTDWRTRIKPQMDAFRTQYPKHEIIQCPATYVKTTCNDCGICTKLKPGQVIAFPAHGNSKKRMIT